MISVEQGQSQSQPCWRTAADRKMIVFKLAYFVKTHWKKSVSVPQVWMLCTSDKQGALKPGILSSCWFILSFLMQKGNPVGIR